jgi:hypothetical protein
MLHDIETIQIDKTCILIKYIFCEGKRPTHIVRKYVDRVMNAVEDSELYKMLASKYDVAYVSCFREDHPPTMTDKQIEDAFLRIIEKEGKILDNYIKTMDTAESKLNEHIKDLFTK